jgi:hypothetical protein
MYVVGAVLIHADRRTDRHDDANSCRFYIAFPKYANAPKNKMWCRTSILNFLRLHVSGTFSLAISRMT